MNIEAATLKALEVIGRTEDEVILTWTETRGAWVFHPRSKEGAAFRGGYSVCVLHSGEAFECPEFALEEISNSALGLFGKMRRWYARKFIYGGEPIVPSEVLEEYERMKERGEI